MTTKATITGPACGCWRYPVRLHDGHCCFADDSTCHPVPEDMRAEVLTALRAAWDEPFTAPASDAEACARRGLLARYLADVILWSPVRATAGGMTLVSSGWSRERWDAAGAVADIGTPEWVTALGAHEEAVLTADGRPAVRGASCADPGDAAGWVRFEAWSAAGCVECGHVCPDCRRLIPAE